MVSLADFIVSIARTGVQVFLATHSLFLMRELSLRLSLDDNQEIDRRFFALHRPIDENFVHVSDGTSAEEIEPIAALDAEMEQSDRYNLRRELRYVDRHALYTSLQHNQDLPWTVS